MTGGWKISLAFVAQNLTSRAFSQMSYDALSSRKHVDELQRSVNSLRLVGVAALGGFGAAATNVFVQVGKSAANYQDQMLTLQQILGATKEQMVGLDKAITGVTIGDNATIFNQVQASGIARALASRGFNINQIESLMPIAANAAEVITHRNPGLSPEDSTRSMFGALRAFGYTDGSKKTQDAVDTAIKAMSITHLSPAGMQQVEQYSGVISRVMNWSLQDVLRATVLGTQNGLTPQKVGTSMRNMFLGLIPKGDLDKPTGHDAAMAALGLLAPADLKRARALFSQYNNELASHGIPGVDYANMTVAKRASLAEGYVERTMGNNAPNLDTLVSHLHAAYLAAAAPGGIGQAAFLAQITKFGQKWGTPYIAELAREGPDKLKGIDAQILKQQDAKSVAADYRNRDLLTQWIMVGKQRDTLMTRLGGAQGTEFITGSPAWIMQQGTKLLIAFLHQLGNLTNAFPRLTAWLGTTIGLLGLAGLAGAGLYTIMTLRQLTAAIWQMGAAAGLSKGGFVQTVLGFRGLPGAMSAERELANGYVAVEGAGSLEFQRAMAMFRGGEAVEGGAVVASKAGFGAQVGMRFARMGEQFMGVMGKIATPLMFLMNPLGKVGGLFSKLAPVLETVGMWAARLLLGMISWPVAIAAIVATILTMLWKMPDKVGYIMGWLVGAVVHFAVVAGQAFMSLMTNILSTIGNAAHYVITHPEFLVNPVGAAADMAAYLQKSGVKGPDWAKEFSTKTTQFSKSFGAGYASWNPTTNVTVNVDGKKALAVQVKKNARKAALGNGGASVSVGHTYADAAHAPSW
jgi:hypothetical protein